MKGKLQPRISLTMVSLGVILFLALVFPAQAEQLHRFPSGPTWSNTYVSGQAYSAEPTHDNGFIVAGYAGYGWVMKTDSQGKPEWENYYTPTGYLRSSLSLAPVETRDGGYILGGNAVSINYTTGVDAWLLKLDRKGNVEWSKTYGGPRDDYFEMVGQTLDGGYIAAGNTELIGPHIMNGWIVRLDHLGNIVWQEAFAGEDIHYVSPTLDGGFLVSGAVGIPGNAALWVFKLDVRGKMVWQSAYDFSHGQYPVFVAITRTHQTRDGGYILAAHIESLVFGDSPPRQTIFLRLDAHGTILWQKVYGDGIGTTSPSSIEETSSGGFIAAGNSEPSYINGGFVGVRGPWLLRLDSAGNIVWQNIYGVTNDSFSEAQESRDGGFIVAGFFSNLDSTWVLKTDSDGNIQSCSKIAPINATLVDIAAAVSETEVTPVTTNATVTQTGVTVTNVPALPQTQCTSVLDHSDRDNGHGGRIGVKNATAQRIGKSRKYWIEKREPHSR